MKGKAACVIPLSALSYSDCLLGPFESPIVLHSSDWLSCRDPRSAATPFVSSQPSLVAAPVLTKFDFRLHTSRDFTPKMATNASTPQNIIIEPGSNGGTEDLFHANASRTMARTIVAMAGVAHQTDTNLPKFRWGVGMDVADAYMWIQRKNLPTLAVLSFWFTIDRIDDQRFRVWVYALRRNGCKEDCKRTSRNYIDKMRMVCRSVFSMSGPPNVGVLEDLIDADVLGKSDAFWEEFSNVYISKSIDDAYHTLSDGNIINVGNLMYPPFHPIYCMRE